MQVRKSGRPFHRSLIKIGTRLLLGRSKSHFQDWLPGLEFQTRSDNNATTIIYKGQSLANAVNFRDLQWPDTIAIVGSGPSINQCRIDHIPPHQAILLNGAIKLIGTEIRDPLAIAIEDERFIWHHFDFVQNYVGRDTTCLLSLEVIRAICELDRTWISGRKIVLIRNGLAPYQHKRRSVSDFARECSVFGAQNGAISLDPDCGTIPAGSVATTVTQFAVASQPKHILFFGIDLNNSQQPRFYEKEGAVSFSGLARAEVRLLGAFEAVKIYADGHGIQLSCCSPVSSLLKIGYPYDPAYEADAKL
ncbi:hypothetical protein A6U87_08365 [Rhizobium sp. AC44/96]|uniref:hypothetical protein n=1 Tax=unclassified Rhizobium TaxID=2613769 RepID=UPI00080FC88C|nr:MULTISPECIES: hypothetical protein [unclassified Rhizobium]MDM9622819.1 glycosyl transferase [Rhizobium sp. S96]OCJ13273.1 hypothetical protein A6U87_08365 [Rhizobium sp. AC44/96]